MSCKYCQQGTPLQHGVHMGEFEMHKCERIELELVPMTKEPEVREKWHQPEKRTDLPFSFWGGV